MKKTLKKLLPFLLAVLVMLLPLATAFAADTITIDLGYAPFSQITGVLDTTTGVLTISGTGAMAPNPGGSSPIYDYRDLVTSVIIESGVSDIGEFEFNSCSNLTTVTIAETVTSIADYAFMDCKALATIYYSSEGGVFISSKAFYGVGTDVVTQKIAYCKPSNTTFASLISTAGYTVRSIPLTSTGTESVEATVPVTGTINATTISVTHPVSVEYAIDPNLGREGGAFIAPDIAITNNSIVPIRVTVKSLSSAATGSVQFTDVAPGSRDWEHLGVAESKSCIALGVQIANSTGWKAGYKADTRYAVDTGDTLFGTLGTGETGNMSMVANYGLSIDQNLTAAHNLVFMFDLA